MITTWNDVFAAFDRSPTKLGNAIGANRQTAHAIITRGSIPPLWWDALVRHAVKEKIKGITYESLGRLAAKNGASAE